MNYFIYCVCVLLGFGVQVGIKMQSFKSRMNSSRLIFKPRDYFSDDWISLAISFITCILWIIMIPELEIKYPGISGWLRMISAFMGYASTSIFLWAFSQFDKRIKDAALYKADIAGQATGTGDALTPAAKPVKQPVTPLPPTDPPQP